MRVSGPSPYLLVTCIVGLIEGMLSLTRVLTKSLTMALAPLLARLPGAATPRPNRHLKLLATDQLIDLRYPG